ALGDCIPLMSLTPCFLPSSSSVGRSMALPSSSLRGLLTLAPPSATISSRQLSGVRRALTSASPFRVWGEGLPRAGPPPVEGNGRGGFFGGVGVGFFAAAGGAAPLAA